MMPKNHHSSVEDDVMRIRTRYIKALRAGMRPAEAAVFANGADSAECSVPVAAQTAAPSVDHDNGGAHSKSDGGSESVAMADQLPPKLAFSTSPANTGHHEKSDRPAHYPDRVVLQALLAQDLNAFSEFAFGVVRPGLLFKPNWHLQAVAEKLSQVASGRIRRLIITLPPRNLKSLYASVALPAWFLGHYPWERVVVVSYSDILARSHANDFRLLVNHPIYQASFPAMCLERDTDREITTTKRGKRFATSIEGTLTGFGGNLIIIDDPLKPGDAMSESVRARVIEWYRSTLLSRPDDKNAARIVLVMQRVHENDLVGYLLEQGGFEVLNLPAIAQRTETFDLGDGRTHTRQKGELLHPDHEPPHVLIELKRNMGPIAFSAQYQQCPIPPGGTIIKRKWLKTYDDIQSQSGDTVVMSWDIALSETESGDYSACVVLLRRQEVFYILEVIRGRFPFEALKRKVMAVKQRYGGAAKLLIEDSPISRGLIQSLREQSINVTPYKPDTDKRARLIAQCDLFAGDSVRLPRRAEWLEEFTAELLAFPGRHDDQVDALTQGLAWGRHDWAKRPSWGFVRGLH
jgi:predicted phage terminase large subunit-like protein